VARHWTDDVGDHSGQTSERDHRPQDQDRHSREDLYPRQAEQGDVGNSRRNCKRGGEHPVQLGAGVVVDRQVAELAEGPAEDDDAQDKPTPLNEESPE
jgi:hypothetical protein